ncbi:MAG: CNNM domain-containing protein [Candidatus Omnitrophica bacterium]|nr:CNNM domain-containing protein [Candidatus Omnitrophota bacterium]
MFALGIFIFILLQAFFVASEISFISCDLVKLHYYKNEGHKKAEKVYKLLLQPERFLATTLIGINLSLVASSCLLTFFLIKLNIPESSLFATIFFTPIVVIFSELVPKNIGRYFREDFCFLVVDIITFFEKMFLPIINIIEIVSKFLIKIFVGKVRKRSLFVTKEEIKFLIKEVEETGGIDKKEREAIDKVFDFTKTKIKDITVRLDKIIGPQYNDSHDKILEFTKKTRFTRYPVFKDSKIIGYITVYDLFYNKGDWQNFIRPIIKIDAQENLYQVFKNLKSKKENIALVVENNRPFGIVTLQDLTKAIVNSII